MGLWILGSAVVSCKPRHGCRGEEARSKGPIWLILTARVLAFSILRVHDGCGSTLEEGVVIVPLGLELLLLKASVLPEVSQVGQGLPDDQEEDTNEHNT